MFHLIHIVIGALMVVSIMEVNANIDGAVFFPPQPAVPPAGGPPINTPPINPPPVGVPTPTTPTPTPTPTPTMPTNQMVDCTSSSSTGPWGSCEGEWGEWDKAFHIRTLDGSECRTITTTSSCGGTTRDQACRPCSLEQEDSVDPVCESVVDWGSRPLEAVVLNCTDDLSGCDESSYENGEINANRTEVLPARACDVAGNCVDCPITNPDDVAPTCTATFRFPGRWHRSDEFEANGGDLKCWLEGCEDEGGAGCLPLGTLENTPKMYLDAGGMIEQVQVEEDSLDPEHRDTCTIQVCDNAGNCSTCESPEIAYDGTNVCRSADQNCGDCAEDDVDCQCISGNRDKCTNSGPVNCYADPFNLRCPGFDNEACMDNAFIPGCPVFNPCYPESNRDHPRLEGAECPSDAIRFCSRNPYHYGCNEACRLGLIECNPDVPEGVPNHEQWDIPLVGVQSVSPRANCPQLGDCPAGFVAVREGVDENGCVIANCVEPQLCLSPERTTYQHWVGQDGVEEGAETGREGANAEWLCPAGSVLGGIVWYESGDENGLNSDYGDNIGIQCRDISGDGATTYQHWVGRDGVEEGPETGRIGANSEWVCPEGSFMRGVVWYERDDPGSDYGDNIGIQCVNGMGQITYQHWVGQDGVGEGAETGRIGANAEWVCSRESVMTGIVWYELTDWGDNIGIRCGEIVSNPTVCSEAP